MLAEEQAMQNEVKELLYYVQQRLFLRYNDVFTEFINPASLSNGWKCESAVAAVCYGISSIYSA